MYSNMRTLRYLRKADRKAARTQRAATPARVVNQATLDHAPITGTGLAVCLVCAAARSLKLSGRAGTCYATCEVHNPATCAVMPERNPVASYTVRRYYLNRGDVTRYA